MRAFIASSFFFISSLTSLVYLHVLPTARLYNSIAHFAHNTIAENDHIIHHNNHTDTHTAHNTEVIAESHTSHHNAHISTQIEADNSLLFCRNDTILDVILLKNHIIGVVDVENHNHNSVSIFCIPLTNVDRCHNAVSLCFFISSKNCHHFDVRLTSTASRSENFIFHSLASLFIASLDTPNCFASSS